MTFEALEPRGAGAIVREARERSGVTQADLAVRAGTAQSAISRLERGRISPTVETLERLVSVVGYELVITLRPKRGTNGPSEP